METKKIYRGVKVAGIIAAASALTVAFSVLATSIGTNITVSGNSTFGDAATDVNLFTGTLQASTTALFTSGLTAYGAVESAITRATGATGSFQNFAGDLTYQGAAGGTSFYHAGVMGNFLGDTLTNTNATAHAGVIGKYSVTTSDGLVGAKAGLVGELETDIGDFAVVAILGGDGGEITPRAAFGVQYFNSTAASKFDFGLDLFHAETTGYTGSAVDYGTADIRLQNSETISNATDGVITLGGAALLNREATSSPTTDTTLTAAQSGTTFYIGTAGLDLTLPAIGGTSGVWYRFVDSTAISTTNMTIIAPANILQGPIDVNSTLVLCTSEDLISFVQTADVIGDWVEVRSDGTNWFVTGQAQAAGGITCD
ncbi:MAG: hypothetical protein HYT40_01795 [Candidatus Sungbacteria bacterium]|uniref:Uncharacterized protein n=1 Tax=Candidatus Sungiibacteriota bacterium TaxID=2750080 RepID=A0A931WPK0_9BACT|nr:hypothetical protein [Candidatus Sungbacteria bacterium]